MTNWNVTRRTLVLGSADSKTGWYAKTYTTSTVDMAIYPRNRRQAALNMGFIPHYEISGYCAVPILEGDEVEDAFGNFYAVELVDPYQVGDTFYYNECSLSKLPLHAERPTTSGTWASVDDPRYRMKAWLDTYLLAANLEKDDASTAATFTVCFDNPDYPIPRVFIDKAVDLVFTVGEPASEPLLNADKSTHSYRETVPVEIFVVNKTGLTAVNLKWQAERELRRIAETYMFSSVRTIRATAPRPFNAGSTMISSYQYTINYLRDTT